MSGPAWGKELLTWSVIDFPPFQVLEGKQSGTGSFDGELQRIIDEMPEFEHEIVPMSFARRKEEFSKGTNMCTPGIFLAPAKALHLAISKPALTHLDNRIIFLKKKAALFGKENPVDLKKLFARKDIIGGMVAGRSYSPSIDKAIQHYKDSPNLVIRSLTGERLFQMLLGGEVDYLIMFSHEAEFHGNSLGVSNSFLNRPIAATPPYNYTYVACTGNAWGQAVINKVNLVLDRERGKKIYRSFSERWYPVEDRKKVRSYYPLMIKE
jgi:uncharacterized protein (TIGR02285 family)